MKFAKSSFFACPQGDRTRSVGLGPTGMKPLRPLGGESTNHLGLSLFPRCDPEPFSGQEVCVMVF